MNLCSLGTRNWTNFHIVYWKWNGKSLFYFPYSVKLRWANYQIFFLCIQIIKEVLQHCMEKIPVTIKKKPLWSSPYLLVLIMKIGIKVVTLTGKNKSFPDESYLAPSLLCAHVHSPSSNWRGLLIIKYEMVQVWFDFHFKCSFNIVFIEIEFIQFYKMDNLRRKTLLVLKNGKPVGFFAT